MDDGAALALLIQGLTAWHLYRTSAKLAKGESVVVVSGAGGVGSLAVQLAKPFGAGRVIATASSEEKRARTLELGADAAVDPAAEDLTAAILEANGAGKWTWCWRCPGGTCSTPRWRRSRRSGGRSPTGSRAVSRTSSRPAG